MKVGQADVEQTREGKVGNYLEAEGVEEDVDVPEFRTKGEWWVELTVWEGAIRLAI